MNETKRALILVTNDDGIRSPGIRAAIQCMLDLGDIWVVAPRAQQSGLGRSFPSHLSEEAKAGFLQLGDAQVRSFAIDASPAQAVRHAVLRLLPRRPDLTISGINYGENVGGCVTISGTVGAAIEAASLGVPALAASLETDREYHFSHSDKVDFGVAAVIVRRFAKHLLAHGMPQGVDFLKVDVPCSAQLDTPWRTTRVSRQQYFVNRVIIDEQGQKQLSRYAVDIDFDALEPDSDVHALAVDRVISVTPMTIDLTAKVNLSRLQDSLVIDDSFCGDHSAAGQP